MRWTNRYRNCGLRRARVVSSQPTTHQRVHHQYKGKKKGRGRVGLAPSHTPRCLPDVTLLWLWVVDPKPFFCRARRYDERYVEHRLAVAPVAPKHRVVVTLKEAFARLVDSLLTVLGIEKSQHQT